MKTNEDEIIQIERSKDSVRRFIKAFLIIKETPYWFHQTLTIGGKPDSATAKRALKRLLDTLEKGFPAMAAFFVEEKQKNLGVHFHVIFLFFDSQSQSPKEMRETFSKEVFARWRKVNNGNVNGAANLMKLRCKNFDCIDYLLGGVIPTDKSLPRAPHWNGFKNKKLIAANSLPASSVPKSLVSDYFRRIFNPTRLSLAGCEPKKVSTEPAPKYYTKQDIQRMENYSKGMPRHEWELYKLQEMGLVGKREHVSDEDFRQYLNKPFSEWLKRNTPESTLEF
jgi:hypothetical protein